jgi:hypothetical protein
LLKIHDGRGRGDFMAENGIQAKDMNVRVRGAYPMVGKDFLCDSQAHIFPLLVGSVKNPISLNRFAPRRCGVFTIRLTPRGSQALISGFSRNRFAIMMVTGRTVLTRFTGLATKLRIFHVLSMAADRFAKNRTPQRYSS